MSHKSSNAQPISLDTLPVEVLYSILGFLDFDSLLNVIDYNDKWNCIVQEVICRRGTYDKAMHYACSLGMTRTIRKLVENCRMNPSFYDGEWLYNATRRSYVGAMQPMGRIRFMHPLLTAGVHDQMEAFELLLELGSSLEMPERGCGLRFIQPLMRKFKSWLATKEKQRYIWKLLQYENGRKVLGLFWGEQPTYPYCDYVLLERFRQARPVTAVAMAGMGPDIVAKMLEYSDEVNQSREHGSIFEPLTLLTALLSWDGQADAERSIEDAIKKGARIEGACASWICRQPVQRVRIEPETIPRVWIAMSVPVYMAATRMARDGVRWPMETCLQHGADVNDDGICVMAMREMGLTHQNIEIVKLTPILVYLLFVRWWDDDEGFAERVLDDVNYLLDRGAYLIRSSTTEDLEAKWKPKLRRKHQWRKVVCYSPVDLLLRWWRWPDDAQVQRHALYRRGCFDVVRGLVEMGCEGPRVREDRETYAVVCRERGIEVGEGDVDESGGDEEVGVCGELSEGYDLVD